jgi:hypothetical protein
MGLDAKTYWLTDRQSQCNFDFDFDFEVESELRESVEAAVEGDREEEAYCVLYWFVKCGK